jgi:glycine/D-amino acid oxidase-like deaminating enzyme
LLGDDRATVGVRRCRENRSVTTVVARHPRSEVLVVGGSLVGLSTAVSLAHRGKTVTVLERTGRTGYEGGGGLGVDLGLLTEVTGLTGSPPVCEGLDRATTAWSLLAG